MRIESKAPTRVDLAGGTLDIWPLYLFHPGALTINAAITRYASCVIETRGVGRAIYDRAFPAATGRPLAQLALVSGRTELDIMAETLRINGIQPTDGLVTKLADALVQGYEDAREELRTVGRALPGAHEILASFGYQVMFATAVA